MRQDIRFGLRLMLRNPGLTAIAVLTLALGIGVNVAIFNIVNTILFRSLPVKAANRLVVIWVTNLKAGWNRIGPSGQDYLDWKEQNQCFEDLFLFEHGTGTVTGGGEPEQVAGLRVTTNFGDFFGITPVLGRTFRVEETTAAHKFAVLGYRYWQRRYGADPAVVGRGLTLNGEPYTIIGVLPEEVATVFPADLVVPFDNDWLKRVDSDLGVFGRLKAGMNVGRASSEMSGIMEHIGSVRPARLGYGSVLVPLQSVRMEYIRPVLLVLLGAAVFVFLIAAANVGNLMLSRAVGRQGEIALRAALGAGRARLVRQFLAESTLLALFGGAGGLMLAYWTTLILPRFVPSRIPVPNAADYVSLPQIRLGGTAVAFTVLLSLVTGLIFGLIPALQSVRRQVGDSIRESGRGFASSHGGRMRSALVIVEAALALVLVIGAGLMMESFSRLLATNPGFRADHLLTLRIKLANDVKDSPYRSGAQRAAAFQAFLHGIEALPGVQSAAFTEIVPLSQDDMDMGFFVVKEQPPLALGVHLSADFRDITPAYFRTMSVPLIRGRAFTEHDNADGPRVVIIDETLARHFFPNQDPIGQHLQIPDAKRTPREIVGVVGAVLDTGFDQHARPTIYFPSLQNPDQAMSLVVRTDLPASAVVPAIKNAVWSVDKDQPVFNVRAMDEIVSGITSAQRIAFVALDVFAVLALVLAAIGIYGVTSYAASRRTHEIGIRMALGAGRGDVLRLIMGEAMKLALSGIGIGVAAAFGLTHFMSSLLFGVSASDPLTFGGVAALLAGVAMLACYLPARRSVGVDPTVCLRD